MQKEETAKRLKTAQIDYVGNLLDLSIPREFAEIEAWNLEFEACLLEMGFDGATATRLET